MSTMDFTVRPVTAAQWPALEDLFGRSGASNGCWCMYWRIGPRYRDRPRADNKEDLRQLAASGRQRVPRSMGSSHRRRRVFAHRVE